MRGLSTINERAWAVELISEINLLASARSRTIQSAGGEWGIASASGGNVLFPDVLLYGDPSRNAVLQGWELKMPDTPVTDAKLLENAHEKCRRLGLSSFIVWNAVDAELFLVDGDKREVVRTWHCDGIQKREDVQHKRHIWRGLLATIINDLNDYFEQGTLSGTKPLPAQLNDVVTAIIDEWSGVLESHLREEEKRSRQWRAEVSGWWRGAKPEHGSPSEEQKFGILATEILLHWVHRFLFAHYLKRFATAAAAIDSLHGRSTVQDAEKLFQELSSKHDFAQIFHSRSGAERLPAQVWNALLSFNGFLRDVQLPNLDQNLFHETLQLVRQESQRKIAGQFCTPQPLAVLLVKLTVDDLRLPVLDPCCGTGTIAREVLAAKLKHGISSADAVKTTWASDRYAMPLQFASLALTCGEAPFETLRVFQHDVTTLNPCESISFIDAKTGKPFASKLPSFPCIVTNPPFVRFENWMRKDTSIADIRAFVHDKADENIDSKSDYFVPIVLHLWSLLSEGTGRLGVIFANAWLGADWGIAFRRSLRKFFIIEDVVTSGEGRWFQKVDVVTNIVILRKRDVIAAPEADERISFAVTQRKLSEWSDDDTSAISSGIIQENAAENGVVRINRVATTELDRFDAAGLCWSAHFADLSWLERLSSLFAPLSSLFEVHRGERRGWDKLFFPPADSGIESCYLRPVLKSATDVRRLTARAGGKAFCCSRTLAELGRKGHVGALAWIKQFQPAKNEKGVLLTRSLARSNSLWYEMNPDTVADLAVSMNPDKRLFFARLKPRAFVNQRLIRMTAKESVDVELCHALLCSVMGCFYLESLGFGRGLGVLDLNAGKLARQMRILNPELLSMECRKDVLEAFKVLMKRDVAAFETEMTLPDRINFECAVAASFGFSDILPAIRESVFVLHRIRGAAHKQNRDAIKA